MNTLNLLPAEPVLTQLAELKQLLTSALAAAEDTTAPAYLPLSKLATHFGLSRRTCARLICRARIAGAIEVLTPPADPGTTGTHPLYSVADFIAWMRTTSTTPANYRPAV